MGDIGHLDEPDGIIAGDFQPGYLEDSQQQHLAEDGVTFIGLKSSGLRTAVYWLLVVFSAGLFFLAAKILPYLQAKVLFSVCNLRDADRILVRRYDEGTAVFEIIRVHHSDTGIRWLSYMYYRYLWTVHSDNRPSAWVKVKYELQKQTFEKLYLSHCRGLTDQESQKRIERYGANALEVPVPSYFKLFYTEVIHPFYIFQVVSVAIWLWDDYWIYASCIFVMAVASALFSVWQARKNREMLAEMCKSESVVRVLRKSVDGTLDFHTIASRDVAPGDLVEVRAQTNVPCDLLLIQGQCVLNEASLTGESVPVSKAPIPHRETETFHLDVHGAKHILFNGTSILQTRPAPRPSSVPVTSLHTSSNLIGAPFDRRNPLVRMDSSSDGMDLKFAPGEASENMVLGLAISTGFSTAKGDLIRSILFPRPTRFKFYRDSMRFIGVLLCIALIGLVYTIIIFSKWGSPVASMLKRALDLITITVPPALPIAMSIATAFSVRRLKDLSIYCTSPQRINVCGRIDVMCFDKTGTLTEDSLDVFGVLPVRASPHALATASSTTLAVPASPSVRAAPKPAQVVFSPFLQNPLESPLPLLHALASCHSLNSLHGNLIGDPLEIKMFEATGWSLIDSGVVRSSDLLTSSRALKFFEFSAILQRMSVIVEEVSISETSAPPALYVYTKGAPEIIRSLCMPSTVPSTFDRELATFTQQGKRVLALARKPLQSGLPKERIVSNIGRVEAEAQLSFLGLFVLQNQLKEDTAHAILNIRGGTVTNVMVTGDNEFTAINVARQCGILDETDSGLHSAAVYLISLKMSQDIPIGLQFTYVPGIDPNGPDGDARRHTIVDLHESSSFDFLPDSITGSDDGDDHHHHHHPGLIEQSRDELELQVLNSPPRRPRSHQSSNGSFDSSSMDHQVGEMRNEPSSPHFLSKVPHRGSQPTFLLQYSSIDDIKHSNSVFAVHGRAFDYIRMNDRKLFAHILTHGRVYARMSPFDKTHLIEGLQTLGHTVGMCGDGANDVGALKAADVGLSLSDAEASVAAPFTSKVTSIQSMWTLLREGRCALASSISCYKYMAVYSMIQLITCVLLYSIWWDSRLTDPQFLWIDIFLVFPLSFLMGATRPRDELSSRKPPGALVSLSVVGSVVLQTSLHFVCQLTFFLYLTKLYIPQYHSDWDKETKTKFRVAALFMFANFQYVGTCLAYSISKPWRRVFWSNLPFAASLILLFAGNIYMVCIPPNWLAKLLELYPMEGWLKFALIAAAIFEMAVAWSIERLLIIAWLQPSEEKATKLISLEHWADDPKVPVSH
jgi:cation-transporting ATPase 13A3/4/5